MRRDKYLIIGPARSGKDTLAEIWRDEYGVTFASSSETAAEIFLYEALKDRYGYSTPKECFEDRFNHRAEWYELICDYNRDDKAKLAKDILSRADIYVGMRDRDEIMECRRQNLFDVVIWIDASTRVPPEDASSFNIEIDIADIIINNNGSLEEFKRKAVSLGNQLFYDKIRENKENRAKQLHLLR